MWIYLTLLSAIFLGVYDITKKKSLQKNAVMWVLFAVSVLSCILLIPFFSLNQNGLSGSCQDIKDSLRHLAILAPKSALVTLSWISGLMGMKLLPLTTVSTLKASRPVFVLVFSFIIFGERLSPLQWIGVGIALSALWLLSRVSHREGIFFSRNRGFAWMCLSIVSGVSSALYDKYCVGIMDPVFVLCWTNLFIAVLMGITLAGWILITRKRAADNGGTESSLTLTRFHWDWWLLATALLIVSADAFYFIALKQEGALLSIISIIRRSSAIVSFILSAIFFHEKNVKRKAMAMGLLFIAIAILVFVS